MFFRIFMDTVNFCQVGVFIGTVTSCLRPQIMLLWKNLFIWFTAYKKKNLLR